MLRPHTTASAAGGAPFSSSTSSTNPTRTSTTLLLLFPSLESTLGHHHHHRSHFFRALASPAYRPDREGSHPAFITQLQDLYQEDLPSQRKREMMMLVNCSQCGTPLQLPANVRSIRCAICNAVTNIADPRSLPPPLPSSWSAAPPPPPAATFGLSNYAPAPPSAHGRKKAVICGISYRNSRHELKGCINDSKYMKYLLMNRFHFPESSIIMLTEEETDPFKRPTKQNMRMAIYWLVQGCQPGDSLVFHYSGHGSQQRNYNGDEVDGYDETLLPLDFETQGMIVDDEINETLVRPLPRGARLHALIDACHSGTVLDLPYLCRMDRTGRYAWEDHRPPSGVWKGTSGGEAISISGCDDNQTSADTSALSRITSTGAMTFCFIQAIERGAGTTYGNLLNAMRTTIRSANVGGGGGPVVSLLTMLLNGDSGAGGLTQEPQLTSNEMFDVYSKPFYI